MQATLMLLLQTTIVRDKRLKKGALLRSKSVANISFWAGSNPLIKFEVPYKTDELVVWTDSSLADSGIHFQVKQADAQTGFSRSVTGLGDFLSPNGPVTLLADQNRVSSDGGRKNRDMKNAKRCNAWKLAAVVLQRVLHPLRGLRLRQHRHRQWYWNQGEPHCPSRTSKSPKHALPSL